MFPAEVAKQYYEAQRLYALGKAAEALALLDAMDRQAPNHPEIMHARALCLHAKGNLRDALKLCNQLFTMHRDRRGLDLHNKWTNPRWGADTAIAAESEPQAAPEGERPPPAAAYPPPAPAPAPAPMVASVAAMDSAFLRETAVLCVGFSAKPRPADAVSMEEVPARLRTAGCTVADYNAALAHEYEVCLPHAARLLEQARSAGLPVVLLQLGFQCPDASDLSPYVYLRMQEDFGPDVAAWPGRVGSPAAMPAEALTQGPADRVLYMTGDDAFTSTNLRFVLRNLAMKNLILLGGPVETALARTAVTAKQRGFPLAVVIDATFAARESAREECIRELAPGYAITADEFIALCNVLH